MYSSPLVFGICIINTGLIYCSLFEEHSSLTNFIYVQLKLTIFSGLGSIYLTLFFIEFNLYWIKQRLYEGLIFYRIKKKVTYTIKCYDKYIQ